MPPVVIVCRIHRLYKTLEPFVKLWNHSQFRCSEHYMHVIFLYYNATIASELHRVIITHQDHQNIKLSTSDEIYSTKK